MRAVAGRGVVARGREEPPTTAPRRGHNKEGGGGGAGRPRDAPPLPP